MGQQAVMSPSRLRSLQFDLEFVLSKILSSCPCGFPLGSPFHLLKEMAVCKWYKSPTCKEECTGLYVWCIVD